MSRGCHNKSELCWKGLIAQLELEGIQREMDRQLIKEDSNTCIDKIYVCTTEKDDPRIKPNPGMILEACQDFGVDPTVDCVFIGDTLTDMKGAKAGGVWTRILVETGYGFSLMGKTPTTSTVELIKEHTSLPNNEQTMIPLPSELKSTTPFLYATNLATTVSSVLLNC